MDIKNLLQDMSNAALGELSESSGKIAAYVKQSLAEKEASLKELYEGYTAGHIDEAGLERELKRELKVMEVKLLTAKVMKKAAAERAVNAAMDVFKNAVKGVLP